MTKEICTLAFDQIDSDCTYPGEQVYVRMDGRYEAIVYVYPDKVTAIVHQWAASTREGAPLQTRESSHPYSPDHALLLAFRGLSLAS